MLNLRILLLSILISSMSYSQDGLQFSFVDAYQLYKFSALPTTKDVTDSIYKYSHLNLINLDINNMSVVDSILQFEIENATSLQGEFYWNHLYYRFLHKNNFLGKNLVVLNRNLEIAEQLNDHEKIAEVYNSFAGFYLDNELWNEALDYVWKTRDHAIAAGDSIFEKKYRGAITWALTNIAFNLKDTAIQNVAVKYALETHALSDTLNNSIFTESGFVAALCLARAERRLESIEFAKKCLAQTPPDNWRMKGQMYPLLIEQFKVLNMQDSAYSYVEKLCDWSNEFEREIQPGILLDDGRIVNAYTLTHAVRIYLHFQDYIKAKNVIDKVILNSEIKDEYLIYYYRNYAVKAYQGLGDFKFALECQLKVNKFSDSLDVLELEATNAKNRELFETSMYLEKSNAEKVQAQQKELIDTQEANKKFQFWIFSLGMLTLIIFLSVLYSRFKKTNEQKLIIEEQKLRVEEAHEEIRDSISYAKRIQNAILPPDKLIQTVLPTSFIYYKPKDVVAGDFYWIEPFTHLSEKSSEEEHGVLFAAADCTGHGVPGAMVSVICNGALNRAAREFKLTDPGDILNKAREIVIQEFEKSEEAVRDGMDIALCSLVGRKLKFAGAHNPLWILRNDEIIEIKGDKQPIGSFEMAVPFQSHEFDLLDGDIIYIFSDGYIDQFGGEKGKKFKAKNLKDLLTRFKDLKLEDQKKALDVSFENWRGNLEQVDDICIIGVQV